MTPVIMVCSFALISCSKKDDPPPTNAAVAAPESAKKHPHASTSASATAAPSASASTSADAGPTLTNDPAARHLVAADGPYPSSAEACAHLVAECAKKNEPTTCKCDAAKVAMSGGAPAKNPFLDVVTLSVKGTDTVFPAFRTTAGWFIAPADGLAFSDGDASMGGQTHWRTVRVTSARAEDLYPGGDAELVVRFTSQQDSAYSGSMGGEAKPRTTEDTNEVAVLCTTAFAKPACLDPVQGPPSYKDGAVIKFDPADLGDTKHLVFP